MEKIVVGIDGSDGSKDALRFALEEGRLRGVPVLAVHAWEPPVFVPAIEPVPMPPPVEYPELLEQLQEAAERLVEDAVREVAGDPPPPDVQGVAVEGPAVNVLLDAAAGAGMIVVGSRGLGGFAALLLGSVSEQVARHAPCPVLIYRRKDVATPG